MGHVRPSLPEEEIIRRYRLGETPTELGHAYNIGATSISTLLRRHKISLTVKELKQRRKIVHARKSEPDPTLEQIWGPITAAIRKRWSDDEYYRRAEQASILEPYDFPTAQDPFAHGKAGATRTARL